MPEFYKGTIPILDPERSSDRDILFPKGLDVEYCRGYVERDYDLYPEEMFDQPDQMQLVNPSDDDAYYDEQEATKSSLEHIYLSGPGDTPIFKFADQTRSYYCWGHSTINALMLAFAKQGIRPVPQLSAYAVCAKIMNFANRGGWCGLSGEFVANNGAPTQDKWPQGSWDKKHDNAETWENAKQHRIAESWIDMTRQHYNRNLTMRQVATESFNNNPGPRDYNWQGHSVCGVRWVRIERGDWGQLILNSWTGWGRFGLAVYRGSNAVCNGGLGIRSTTIPRVA